MPGPDLVSLYQQSGPALLGVLNVIAVVAWYDMRQKTAESQQTADDAVTTATEAKQRSIQNGEETNRHEIILDELAGDVEALEKSRDRNDQRIARIRERQAAEWGVDHETSTTESERRQDD